MSDSGEKTQAPTEKRRRDAARKGDVLRSRELATAAGMVVGAAWLKLAGPWLLDELASGLRSGLRFDRAALEAFSVAPILLASLAGVLGPVLLLGALTGVVVLASQLGFGDGGFLGSNLAPKPSRLSPAAGLKRMFGPAGMIELGKSMAKAGLLAAIVYVWGSSQLGSVLALGGAPLAGQLAGGCQAITSLLLALAAGLVTIALLDVPIQWLRRTRRLRMTHQELRDEHKEADGSPEKKAAIRQRQRQLAKGGMQRALRDAQFVITNPSHFAVALAYDPAKAAAPIVLAKARGEKALAMRELAAEFRVPTLEFPALARSVYFTTRENQVIREELYAAVAGVLAFVLALRRGEPAMPPPVDVPIALRFDAEGRADPASTA